MAVIVDGIHYYECRICRSGLSTVDGDMCNDCMLKLSHSGDGGLEDEALSIINDIPDFWSVSFSIHSQDWFAIIWHRWGDLDGDGVKGSSTYEWNLRRFWKIDRTP